MSDNVLSYAPVSNLRPSRAATLSIFFGCLAHLLFVTALVLYAFVAQPAFRAMDNSYYWKKYWLVVVPAWSGMSVALVGTILAIVALAKPNRKRQRAVIALVLCLTVYMWMFA